MISQVAYDPDTLYHNNGDGTFTDVTALLEHDPARLRRRHHDRRRLRRVVVRLRRRRPARPLPRQRLRRTAAGLQPDVAQRRPRRLMADGSSPTCRSTSGTALFMNTMGIGVGDLDRDGDFDMALSNITANKLMRNDGKGTFRRGRAIRHRTPDAGGGRTRRSPGARLLRLQPRRLGRPLPVGAGNFQRPPGVPVGVQPNELFVNDGTGQHFLDVSAATGADDPGETQGRRVRRLRHATVTIDMFVVNQGGPPHLFEQRHAREAIDHWLDRRPGGTIVGSRRCGAVVRLSTAAGDDDAAHRAVRLRRRWFGERPHGPLRRAGADPGAIAVGSRGRRAWCRTSTSARSTSTSTSRSRPRDPQRRARPRRQSSRCPTPASRRRPMPRRARRARRSPSATAR